MSEPRLPPPLIALSPGDLDGEGAVAEQRRTQFLRQLARARDAGLGALLVREPRMSDRALLDLARRAREILGESNWLGLHDRAHLVPAARADALHLGFRSLAPAIARTIVAPEIAIGFSAHAGDDVALWRASDYIVFGPVLDTASKRGIREPVGFDALAGAVRASSSPVWAIGGVKPEHLAEVRASEARGVAVLSGIFGSADPSAACAEYLNAWSRG
jgi:thiamine-phosphate diphosphorylase